MEGAVVVLIKITSPLSSPAEWLFMKQPTTVHMRRPTYIHNTFNDNNFTIGSAGVELYLPSYLRQGISYSENSNGNCLAVN